MVFGAAHDYCIASARFTIVVSGRPSNRDASMEAGRGELERDWCGRHRITARSCCASDTDAPAFAGVALKTLVVLLCLMALTRAHADPRATVQQAFESVLAAGGFRGYAQGHVFGAGLPAMSGEVEVAFPDRIHVRTDEIEFIALPQSAWINAFGVWTQTDRSLLPVTAFDIAAMRQAIASIRDVTVEGTAKTGQCAAHIYRFHS